MKNPAPASGRQPPASAEKMKLLSALTASVFALSAHAATAEAWVDTTTKAHDPRAAAHVAPLRAGEQVDVVVSLKLRNQAGLDALTAGLMARAPGVRPLSSAEFMATYAPTADQAAAVVLYLRAQGFTNIEVAPNNLLVSATGTAGAIRAAFKADLHEYDVDGRRAYANVTDAMVPAHLAGVVNGVVGLQNVHLMHTTLRHEAALDAVPQAAGGITMSNFAAIYDADSMPSATTGIIGIMTAGKVTQTIADLKTFAAKAGYPVPYVTTTVVGKAGSSTSGTAEWNLDSQASLAAAGGSIAQMILYDVTDLSDASLTKGYNKAVTDNLARAINISLGACETDAASIEPTQDAIFQAAAAQGQLFSVSSGDAGAWECGATAGKAQSYPAASPNVFAVGGTTLSTTGGNAWAGETAWSCTSASNCQSGGGGGGPSLTEKAPDWQTSAGVLGASTMRGVPDISFDAAPGTGALVLVNGTQQQIGGTSLAAPLWTGFWTRIQAAHGNALVNAAFLLYADAAKNPGWFHDVTSGNQGYPAAPGWDYATGWGSLQVANFSVGAYGPPPSPPNPPHPSPPPPLRLLNGGFEGSAAPWTVSTGTWCTNTTCTGETAHSGTGFLWLGGDGAAHTETASQAFRVVNFDSTQAQLSFWLHVDTAEKSKTAARDTLTVSITSVGKTTTLATYSNLDAAAGYVVKSFDLGAWLGLPVKLTFTATENGSAQTSFVIDDVQAYVH